MTIITDNTQSPNEVPNSASDAAVTSALHTLSGVAGSSSKLPPLPTINSQTNNQSSSHIADDNYLKSFLMMQGRDPASGIPTIVSPASVATSSVKTDGVSSSPNNTTSPSLAIKRVYSHESLAEDTNSNSENESASNSPRQDRDGSGDSSKVYGDVKHATKRPRVRVAKACNRCKRRKTKCDGMVPCVSCKRSNLQCVYTPTASSRVFTKTKPRSVIAPSNTAIAPTGGPNTLFSSNLAYREPLTRLSNNTSNCDKSQPASSKSILPPILPSSVHISHMSQTNHTLGLPVIPGMSSSNTPDRPVSSPQSQVANNNPLHESQPSTSSRQTTDDQDGNVNKNLNNITNELERLVQTIGSATQQFAKLASHLEQKSNNSSSDYANVVSPEEQESLDRFNLFLGCPSINLHSAESTQSKFFKFLKFRYSRRYANFLPYRFGVSLYNQLPVDIQKKFTIPRLQGYGWNMSGGHYLKPRAIISTEDKFSPEFREELLHYFFENINPFYSILHEPMFEQQYNTFKVTTDKRECCLFMAILNVVCAIAIRFSEVADHKKYELGMEEQMFDDGFFIIQAFSFEWESIEICQGWLLITFYLRTCHRQSSSWYALGQAIRAVTALGLNNRTPFDSHMSEYEKVKRRNVFWACFVMDRALCIDCGRNFSFYQSNISIPIPESFIDDGWQSVLTFGFIKLGLTLKELENDPELLHPDENVRKMTQKLLDWNEFMKAYGLGDDDKIADVPFPIGLVAQYRLTYYSTIYYIHMRSVFNMIDGSLSNSHPDIKLLVGSIRGVNKVTDIMLEQKRLLTPWWLTLSALFHTGCLCLLFISNNIQASEMGAELGKVMNKVTIISKDDRFVMAKECLWSLKTLNHLLLLRMKQTEKTLKSLGIDHGEPSINKGNFFAMGYLDKNGNPKIPVMEDNSSSSTKSSPLHSLSSPAVTSVMSPEAQKGLATVSQSSIDYTSPMTSQGPNLTKDGQSPADRSSRLRGKSYSQDGNFFPTSIPLYPSRTSPQPYDSPSFSSVNSHSASSERPNSNTRLTNNIINSIIGNSNEGDVRRPDKNTNSNGNMNDLLPSHSELKPDYSAMPESFANNANERRQSACLNNLPSANIQDPYFSVDPAVNIDWFSNWNWEFESSLASYLVNTPSVE